MSLGVTKSDVFVAPGFYNKHQLLTAVSEQNKGPIYFYQTISCADFPVFLKFRMQEKGRAR